MLTQKTYKTYQELSRYSDTPYYFNTEDQKYIYGTSSNLDDTTAYIAYIVKRGDTYDSISLNYYNNPTYYWIITDFNRIQNPFENPKEGSVLKIPSITALKWKE